MMRAHLSNGVIMDKKMFWIGSVLFALSVLATAPVAIAIDSVGASLNNPTFMAGVISMIGSMLFTCFSFLSTNE